MLPRVSLRVWTGRAALTVAGATGLVYAFSPGMRRSVSFWSTVAPFVVEFESIKARAKWDRCSDQELEARKASFHQRTAESAVDIILSLGGIYVKLGQLISTIGAGIVEDTYITALRPLQDGVPPRSLAEVSAIVEASVGLPMADIFESFDAAPVGAASIAQAHRATLLGGQEVIVKVQYPEVAELYDADFSNLEVVTRYLFPENVQFIRGLRARHQAELDFRTEAAHLRELGANMRARGFEPDLVRIPTVPDDRLVCRHVLAMEYLRGISLAAAIEAEQADIARALGLSGGADELRAVLMARVRDHFEAGGGARQHLLGVAAAAAPLVRAYAAAARRVRSALLCVARWAAYLGVPLRSALADDGSGGSGSSGSGSGGGSSGSGGGGSGSGGGGSGSGGGGERRHDLSRLVRTLVRVHGCQLLLDGVYNADPHPGNVLVLPDGRLGLIDYGMVGRLSTAERTAVARVVRGLHARDAAAVVREYNDAGYRACWHSGEPHGAAVTYRLATFHLDRIDLSPVVVSVARGGTMPVLRLLQSTIEHAVPDWIEQARRLGGLLIGVGSQAGRPLSLAAEWAPIAEEVLKGHTAAGAPLPHRLRTHLTGI